MPALSQPLSNLYVNTTQKRTGVDKLNSSSLSILLLYLGNNSQIVDI